VVGNLRIDGHGLVFEGSPFSDHGKRLHVGTYGPGRAKCSCGALSPSLTSGYQRKAWHRKHKAEVAQGSAVVQTVTKRAACGGGV